jgi:hypothetical protein
LVASLRKYTASFLLKRRLDPLIRVIGIQRSESPENEFVLLQNQGNLRIALKGHALLSGSVFASGDFYVGAHTFNDDALVPPGMYVILHTGHGEARWSRTKDGGLVYHAYMGKDRPVWQHVDGPLHLLNTQHTYVERPEPALVR